ncbi:MAG TPA: type II secretion system secretin GspD [Kofleriaceae bacterium]|nr:type II secretion system secretin GspD [Kofleriaceae bacterium]
MRRSLLFVSLLASSIAHADPELDPAELYHCEQPPAKVAVSFKPETDLKELVSWAMGFTCKNFMFDPSYVQRGKKINVVTPEQMTPAQAYELFLTALSMMGYTVVAQGNVMRIVESATARAETLPMYSGTQPGEQLVRYLLQPSHVQPQLLATALGAMKSSAGDIEVVGSLLLVTDTSAHVRDMLDIVKQIDQSGGESGVYAIPVLHADATNLAKEIDMLSMTTPAMPSAPNSPASATNSSVPPTKIVVDTRTNTLLVASTKAGFERVAAIVRTIDLPTELETGGQMHIYPLKAAIADEVAKTLEAAISGKAQPSATAAAGASKVGATGVATPAATTPSGPAASIDSLALEGPAHVIADQATNKLIVMSTGHDFVALRHVIDELDEPRREVYIEAVIVDLGTDDTTSLGVSAHGTIPTGGNSTTGPTGITLGGVQTGSLSSINPSTLATAQGLVGGLLGNAITATGATQLLGTSFPSYGVLFQALATLDHESLISAPSIIALDNENAHYSVGETVPIIKGTIPVSPLNPSGAVAQNVEDVDLTLDFDIKPHISEGDDIMLEVKHTQKTEEPGSSSATLGPSWSTRTIETRLVAHDQQTVMLTGLTQIKQSYIKTRVPLLGDLPVLGTLFSYTTKEKKKSNLMILLTPYIIRNRLDIDLIRERHKRQQDEFIGSLKELDTTVFQTNIDYRKKRGVLEEINRAVESVDDEIAARAALVKAPTVVTGPVR